MTFETIMQDMLDRVNDDMDKRQGSIIWDALAPAALELEAAYLIMEYTLNQAFPDTADREYLIRKAVERNLTPISAKPAVVKGVFTPSNAEVTGLRFNLDNENFVVGDAIEGETGAYQLVCEVAGSEGNVSLGNLIPIDHVNGLTSAVATAFISLGTDEEDTETFRQRYFDSLKRTSFAGNIAAYKEKCLSVNGVGGVRVLPAWDGGGTVKCLILDTNLDPANSTLISNVQNALDPDQDGNGYGVVPIGHVLTVAAPSTTTIRIGVIPEFKEGYSWSDVQDSVAAALSNYFLSLRKKWAEDESGNVLTIRITGVENAVLTVEGILDVSNTTIQGNTRNYELSANTIPVLGEIHHE